MTQSCLTGQTLHSPSTARSKSSELQDYLECIYRLLRDMCWARQVVSGFIFAVNVTRGETGEQIKIFDCLL